MSMTALVVRLRTVSGEFENGLQKAVKHSRRSGKQIEQTLGQKFQRVAKLGAGIAAGLGGAAMVGAVAALRKAASEMDALSKSADRLNVSTEALAALRFQAGQAGVETATLERAMRKMQKRAVKAAEGNRTFASAYEQIGLNAERVTNAEPEVALGMIADALNRVENPAQRTALSMQLLGDKAGPQMRTLLAGGSEAIEQYRQRAENLGLTFSRGVGAALESFNDSMDTLGQVSTGIQRQFAAGFAPLLKAIGDLFVSGQVSVKGMATTFNEWADFFARAIASVLNSGQSFQGMLASFMLGWSELKLASLEAVNYIIGLFERLGEQLPERVQRFIGLKDGGWQVDTSAFQQEVEQARIALERIASEDGPGDAFLRSYESAEKQIAATKKGAEVAIPPIKELGRVTKKAAEETKEATETQSAAARLPEPDVSPWERYAKKIAEVNNQVQQLGVQVAQGVGQRVGQVFSAGISGAQSFGEAVRGAAVAIGADLIGALVSYGVQLAIVEAIGQSAAAKGVAAAAANGAAVTAAVAPQAASLAALWGPAAIAASIASFGGASAVGLSSYLAALASGTAATTAAQAASGLLGALTGGLQGSAAGGLTSVPETGTYRLHRGERVLSPEQNRDLVKAMRGGMGGGKVVVENRSGGRVRTEEQGDSMRVIVEAAAELVGKRFERQARKRRGQMFRALELDAAGRA